MTNVESRMSANCDGAGAGQRSARGRKRSAFRWSSSCFGEPINWPGKRGMNRSELIQDFVVAGLNARQVDHVR